MPRFGRSLPGPRTPRCELAMALVPLRKASRLPDGRLRSELRTNKASYPAGALGPVCTSQFDQDDLRGHADAYRNTGGTDAGRDDEVAVLFDDVAVDVAPTV